MRCKDFLTNQKAYTRPEKLPHIAPSRTPSLPAFVVSIIPWRKMPPEQDPKDAKTKTDNRKNANDHFLNRHKPATITTPEMKTLRVIIKVFS